MSKIVMRVTPLQKYLLFVAIIVVLLLLALLFAKQAQTKSDTLSMTLPQKQITIGATAVTVEVAETAQQQNLGLGNRSSLPQDHGMLFPFSQPNQPSFWMYRMHFPLDFIWIANNTVADLAQNVPPPADPNSTNLPLYQPNLPVTSVLEVNAGFVAAHHIAVGDPVTGL